MNCKKNANSNPGEERQLFHPESEKVVEIGLERLRPFKNHPFKVKEDEAMAQLMESIERYGILNPLIVMPTRGNTTRVKNIKKYLLATLFNAPTTIEGYYRAEVNADMPQFAG